MSADEPRPLGEGLEGLLRSLRPAAASSPATAMGGVFGRWEAAVGEVVARHVQPVRLDGTTLVVEVDEPAWATQLRLLESTVKRRLAEEAGAQVTTIEVRVQRPRSAPS